LLSSFTLAQVSEVGLEVLVDVRQQVVIRSSER